jgi:hypothetical protein
VIDLLSSHLSPRTLTRMVDQELSPAERTLTRRHLNRCGQCQTKYNRLERVAITAIEYHTNLIAGLEPLSSATRDQFIRRLDEALDSVPETPWWRRLHAPQLGRHWTSSVPTFGSLVVTILAGAILFFLCRGSLTVVSAAELLNRAIASDCVIRKSHSSGVVFHRLRIKTRQETVEHDVYADISGVHQPKYVKKTAEETDLAARLALAGVNWEDPLSALSFKSWHDQQANPKDEVQGSSNLLTISTRLPSTEIASESLTVTKDSFHPVERVIEYRDASNVTISELSLEVLNWDKAAPFFVESESSKGAMAPRSHAATPLLPGEVQINETELLARLVLNQNAADTGEQIDVSRDTNGVQIHGLVESEDRKAELNKSLKGIPFLTVKIQSLADLNSVANSPTQVATTEERSVKAHVSPLEQFFVEQGRSREDLSRISAGLFNDSISIIRVSRAIEQIASRFSDDTTLSPASVRARDELLSRDVTQLLNDLKQQQEFLDETGISVELAANPQEGNAQLVGLAERNAAATRELISGDGASSRPERGLATELAETISSLRSAALTYAKSNQR